MKYAAFINDKEVTEENITYEEYKFIKENIKKHYLWCWNGYDVERANILVFVRFVEKQMYPEYLKKYQGECQERLKRELEERFKVL